MSAVVGRCGDAAPTFIGVAPEHCELSAGHAGWHHGGGADWSPKRAPVSAVDRGGLRCYCDRDRAGHTWELDEGCTRKPVTTPGNPLRDAIMRELSEWEVFVDADGDLSIRRRESRSPEQIADALLAGPLAPLLTAADAVARVEALADHLDLMSDPYSGPIADRIRAALRGTHPQAATPAASPATTPEGSQ